MALATNPFFMLDCAKVLGITFLVMVVLMAGISLSSRDSLQVFGAGLAVVGAVVLGLGVLMVLVMLLYFGNKLHLAFCVDAQGVTASIRSKRALVGNRLAVILGVLGRSPVTAGAGLLAMAQEDYRIDFGSLRLVRGHPQARVITVRDKWLRQLRLYCTPDNYATVLAAMESGLAWGLARQQRDRETAGPSRLPGRLGRTALVVVTCFLLAGSPVAIPDPLTLCLGAAGLALVWSGGHRPVAVLTLLLVLGTAATVVWEGARTRYLNPGAGEDPYWQRQGIAPDQVPEWALLPTTGFASLDTAEWSGVALGGLGLAAMALLAGAAWRGPLQEKTPQDAAGGHGTQSV